MRRALQLGVGVLCLAAVRLPAEEPGPLDAFPYAGLAPQAAAAAMTVPDGFRVTLLAGEPDVQQPIAQAFDDRGRLWVAEAYSYPIRVADAEARDRILIFADRDGDGAFDERKVFAERLNLVSGLELGFGGVWVGAAPHLLFIPDRDGDDRPDGPPEVLLDGWGFQDTHETLNTFIWGPDGWLYGCHGVFTHSRVGAPGTPDAARVPINAGIWRYHPQRRAFEVFAHGTSNPWGLDFNDRGQAFLTACVIPHLFHVIQGARYTRQAGPHFNPYTFADIPTIARHRHWLGDRPHSGNNRSDAAGGGHAHSGAMIYLGGVWPEEYRDQIFMNNIHGARLNQDRLEAAGSGYVGDRAPDFLLSNDAWSQIVNLQTGPDGQMVLIDWYDRQQCHRREMEVHDRSNGRIFKVSYGPARPPRPVDVARASDDELVAWQLERNDWWVRHARRVLQERGPNPRVHAALRALLRNEADDTRRLRALWALHVTEGLDEPTLLAALDDASPYVRGWAIQLAHERGPPAATVRARLDRLAAEDPSPVVRLYLASALDRSPLDERWERLAALARHAEDAADHNLPLMLWYVAEPLATRDPARLLKLAAEGRTPRLLEFSARRVAGIADPASLAALVTFLTEATDPGVRQVVLLAANEALAGRRDVPRPAGWDPLADALLTGERPELRQLAALVGAKWRDARSLDLLRTTVADRAAPPDARQTALGALVTARAEGLLPLLLALLDEGPLRGAAIRALASLDDDSIPARLLALYPSARPAERQDILNTLAARKASAHALVEAVAAGTLPATDLPADLVRQMRNLGDDKLNARLEAVWGTVQDTPADRQRLIAEWRGKLLARPAQPPEPELGRAVFYKACRQCHKLFGDGGTVGPELTGANRANLDYVLSNVLDPSAVIGKDYQATIVQTSDGRVLTGIVRREDDATVTLATANEVVTLAKTDIDEQARSPKSMMPDDLWRPLGEHEVRSLVAYLAAPAQVPMRATPDNAGTLFALTDGGSTAGGGRATWTREQDELVGRAAPGSEPARLMQDLAAGDFRLLFEARVDAGAGLRVWCRVEQNPRGIARGVWMTVARGATGQVEYWPKSGPQPPSPDAAAQGPTDGWRVCEITARGGQFETRVDGQVVERIEIALAPRHGTFGLELLGTGDVEARLRNVRLELLEPAGNGPAR